MQLATPFLIPTATDITHRKSNKKVNSKALNSDSNGINSSESNDQVIDADEVKQNLARLLASCCDCV